MCHPDTALHLRHAPAPKNISTGIQQPNNYSLKLCFSKMHRFFDFSQKSV